MHAAQRGTPLALAGAIIGKEAELMKSELTHGKPTLWVDQYGQFVVAATVRELRIKAGGGRVSKQYVDKVDGSTSWIGYVVGARWFRAFQPVEVPNAA